MIASILGVAQVGWKLVWSDEFNYTGKPDPAKWTYEEGFVRNRELQWYQPDNAHVENGCLVIEGRRERVKNPNYDPTSKDWKKTREYAEYSSASVTTKKRHNWRYGRWEIRARIDARPGLWPAIWSVGTVGPWPSNGEIDLLEFYQNTILANTAFGVGGGTWKTVRTPFHHFTDKDPQWGSKFHVWRVDWDAKAIKLYLDDELLNETDLTRTINPDGRNPFHDPQQLILNLAIGSTGGDPSKTAFPAKFDVDYVRIYQRQDSSGLGS